MALLELLSEESIGHDHVLDYFDTLYKVVCVGERGGATNHGESVRSTYVMDWEQLVHLLEDYGGFGEDIVQVTAITGEERHILGPSLSGAARMAQA
ncbi:MAG: hypothetical protein ACRDFX_03115 [Chloroflexota bacterium]